MHSGVDCTSGATIAAIPSGTCSGLANTWAVPFAGLVRLATSGVERACAAATPKMSLTA